MRRNIKVEKLIRTCDSFFGGRETFRTRIEVSVNILIAFENTIRRSARILIASADALIVAE